ncbi:hybrid sensor histidine kinase/response regulator [Halorubrum ezzemoulense DSM 17463]|uniref:histidine kinase n=1 Tax=Halorubrum ezzemoulense DSM 17463 TaxID=1121945 RepID=A0A1X4GL77_HALEZ|nr:PAS domain-containing protein [Halorubrum ezzemoulense]MDB2269774.1 PAS domain-containing protein [Halorubrum ezzemoulense]MDB9299426.1 PAS domain-containing protein [Halorubrum ezzemoulense]OSO98425.1 hybrid sensor histidine kinase/response regulator [Halorubrum ezzemoulense DSM 17463]
MPAAIDVLHVDDDPSVLDLTEAYLEREIDSVAVTSVTDPETALDRLDEAAFDCVVSDYDMPAMDGLEFFDVFSDRHGETPFVLYTGKGSEEIASQALNAGVTGYFQKGGPEQLRRLANRVDQAVEEHRTKEIAERYSTVIEALGYPVYVVDETGVFRFVNEPFAELTGYDREEIIGQKPGFIKDDAAVKEAEDRLGTILSSSGPDVQHFGVDIVPKEGEPIPCRDHMAALPYEGDSFNGSVGILRNVSDERERRAELETKTRALDEAPVGITITDADREDNPMVYVNDRFVEMTGYDREESIGVNCRFLQGPDTEEESVQELRHAIDADEPTSVELLNYRKDGTEFWNRVSIAPICDPDGTVTHWVGFQEDITAFKEREAALERQNDRLDSFASIVSHDLRNPLNVAQGRVQLAREASDDAENLDAALDALARMESIVERTLALAREGETVGDPERVDLADVVADSWSTVDTADATLSVETDREVLADPDRLRNLFENLMRNAVDHAGDDVSIRVGDLSDGFFVEDDGSGIDPAVADSLFEPGESGGAGTTGFGLAIVQEIATAHGWTVEATTGEDGGARFEVRGVDKRTPATP